MAANHYKIEGKRIDSLSEFLRLESNNEWSNLLYYPDSLESANRHSLVFSGKRFIEVSFKDTDIKRVRFVRCQFERCLFIGASITECEFVDCKFIETNTSKLKIHKCLIDPLAFEKNFDLKADTNIAIDLYQSLYKNASVEHQPTHAIESLYRMKKAENKHLDSQLQRKVIGLQEFVLKKTSSTIQDFFSGYGLRSLRVTRLLALVIVVFSSLNYFLSDQIFGACKDIGWTDSIYFTFVTITTLGYGDIVPATGFGKVFIVIEVLAGFLVISLFLAAVANRALRSR